MYRDSPIKKYPDFLTSCDNIKLVGCGNTLRESNVLWMRDVRGIFWRIACRGHGSWREIVGWIVDRGMRDVIHRSRGNMRSVRDLRNLLSDFFVLFYFSFDICGLQTVRVGLSTGRFDNCLGLHNSSCTSCIA